MNIPPWAGFVADFPDDQVEDEGGIKMFGGRNVAVALGEILAGLGCSRISEPWTVADVGWEFDCYFGNGHRFLCRVQSFHPVFWLLFEISSNSRKGAEAWVELWRRFGNTLEQDPRFHKILWRSSKDGPPDWDEVEAASDPPPRAFDEEFPPTEIHPQQTSPGCLSSITGFLSVWMGIGLTYNGLFVAIPKEALETTIFGGTLLLFGLWLILRPMIWRRSR